MLLLKKTLIKGARFQAAVPYMPRSPIRIVLLVFN